MELDRDAAAVLEMIRTAGRPPWHTLSPDEARASYMAGRQATAPEPMPVAVVKDLVAPGPHGPIPLRLYRPAAAPAAGAAALVFFHGGGWVLGNLESHDGMCRHLAERSGCVVVAVDYRLAPERKFPAPLDDAGAATAWVAAQAGALGLDPARIAVGGDSAGGNLAAALCLMARDAGGPAIAWQMLLYPATDFAMDTPSHRRFEDGHLLTRESMLWFRDHYLNNTAEAADWRASPLRAASVAGLPPALVLTASHDPLRDEGEAYGRRLAEAGVPVTLWRVPGQIHGFLPMGKAIAASARVLDRLAAMMRGALGW
ncbi:acetylhydrolase [Siccirubricoccus deserti]|uniref:Alpha/beta hydrolase n=1 Tax=Siccirubricoccus deserti TaxID=2013562 RepID=A0A9X0R440_9PROT|nr:alpha/beta hydrolase [Siccirubricoccus deserti]MBC4018078.1 alpha/beta hydrolase [Siccirubricoccus deserti]GGC62676.1 acetylhydrolase [Siccirubricoccus deserti]